MACFPPISHCLPVPLHEHTHGNEQSLPSLLLLLLLLFWLLFAGLLLCPFILPTLSLCIPLSNSVSLSVFLFLSPPMGHVMVYIDRCRPNSGHGAFNQMAMRAKVREALRNPTAGAEQMDICFLQSYLTSCESARAFILLSHNTPPPPLPFAFAEAWHLFTKAHSRDQTAELWSLLTREISVTLHPTGYSSVVDASNYSHFHITHRASVIDSIELYIFFITVSQGYLL